MLSIQDLSPLVEIAGQYSMALQIFNYMWINSSTDESRAGTVRESINKIIPTFVVIFKGTDAVTLLSSIAELLPNLAPDVRLNSGFLIELMLIISGSTSLSQMAKSCHRDA